MRPPKQSLASGQLFEPYPPRGYRVESEQGLYPVGDSSYFYLVWHNGTGGYRVAAAGSERRFLQKAIAKRRTPRLTPRLRGLLATLDDQLVMGSRMPLHLEMKLTRRDRHQLVKLLGGKP